MDDYPQSCEYKESKLCLQYCDDQARICTEISDAPKLINIYQTLSDTLEQAMYDSSFDSTTGLLNKTTFIHNASEALTEAKTTGKDIALIVLDINNFKRYNDEKGHIAGDALLADLGATIIANTRSDDLISGRFGGDEFLFLCNLTPRTRENTLYAEERLQIMQGRIVNIVNDCLSAHAKFLSGAFGASVWDGVAPLEDFMDEVDHKMYQHKKTLKNIRNK